MKLVVTIFHNSRRVKATTNGSAPTERLLFGSSSPACYTDNSGSSPNQLQKGSNGGQRDDFITETCCNALSDFVARAWVCRSISIRPLDDKYHPTVVECTFEISDWSPDGRLRMDVGLKIRKYQAENVGAFERQWDVQLVFQRDTVFRRYKRLCVFDMDSTLIQQEVIDEIARKLGVEDEVSAITHRAMNGELDFTQSLRERCALLRGVPSTVFEELRSVITLTNGAADLVKALKRLGFKTAVLSGGFTPLTAWQAEQLGLDYAFANQLVVSADGQTLTGELEGEIVNGDKKRELVLQIAGREGISLDQVLVIGDGANDLPMMGVAGLGLAFNAKPKVQYEAPSKLNSNTLLDVLYMFGLTREEQEELVREQHLAIGDDIPMVKPCS